MAISSDAQSVKFEICLMPIISKAAYCWEKLKMGKIDQKLSMQLYTLINR